MVTVQSGTKAFVKATVVLAAMALAAPVLAEGRAGDQPTVPSAGNWSRAKSADEARQPAAGAGTSTRKPAARSSSSTVPVPRAKPGSKAAKRDAGPAKKQAAKQQGQQAEESSGSVPVPRAKPKQARKVEAGLPVQGGEAQALVRGNLERNEIKEILVGKTIISRIDGKEARITLGTAGKLVWRSSAGSGNGFWWTENGRVCDRYDPSGDFPGRGAGCRSFEQRGSDYYAGGRRVNFAN
jgi:hypothetical protein